MDSKKVIQNLVKIAANQQKIINKLAQALSTQTPPTSLEPSPTTKAPSETLVRSKLSPQTNAAVANLKFVDAPIPTLWVAFYQGAESDAAFNAVNAAVQSLVNERKLAFPYQVKQTQQSIAKR